MDDETPPTTGIREGVHSMAEATGCAMGCFAPILGLALLVALVRLAFWAVSLIP